MGCARYEVLLVNPHGVARQKREWTETQLLDGVPWLKRMNARGLSVLVRPSGQPGLTLWDRLTAREVAKLERSKVPLSAKIPVEQDRFEIWVNLGTAAASKQLREGISKNLGLPPPSGAKFGALAGFVNYQSVMHGTRGRFVLAHEPVKLGEGAIAKWEGMLKEADKLVRDQERDKSNSRSKGISY